MIYKIFNCTLKNRSGSKQDTIWIRIWTSVHLLETYDFIIDKSQLLVSVFISKFFKVSFGKQTKSIRNLQIKILKEDPVSSCWWRSVHTVKWQHGETLMLKWFWNLHSQNKSGTVEQCERTRITSCSGLVKLVNSDLITRRVFKRLQQLNTLWGHDLCRKI